MQTASRQEKSRRGGTAAADDFVALSALGTEARIIADFIDDLLLPADAA